MSSPAWDVAHPVLELLRKRKAENSTVGSRSDPAKLGLAVEGGGMRGVVSAAMLTALDDLGFAPAIDAVYACSSGAINAAYYLAGETWFPLSIYFDDLTTTKFVDLRRAFGRQSILNIDYAFDILENIKPLDYEFILTSPARFNIAITLVDELRTLVARDFTSTDELYAALRASSWLPIALNGTAQYHDQRAIDGGVLTALPFRLAVQDSCTHILSLSTHPMGVTHESMSLLKRYTRTNLNRMHSGLGDAYVEALREKYADQKMLAATRLHDPGDGPSILDLSPLPGTPDVKRHEIQPGKLIQAARSAYEVMYAALAGRSSSSITQGLVRAIPRFAIAERDKDNGRLIELINGGGSRVPWGISRARSKVR
jgi:predicted patatin/cPLA2 family phospholipase